MCRGNEDSIAIESPRPTRIAGAGCERLRYRVLRFAPPQRDKGFSLLASVLAEV